MPGVNFKDAWLSCLVPLRLIGQTHPRHYGEMLGVLWNNRKQIPYAWQVLTHGVCDGCSLGPYGLRDNVLDGLHLCMTRLKLMQLNTMEAAPLAALNDASRLRRMEPDRLRHLGRLGYPMVRRSGQRGFLRVSWDEAIDVVATGIRNITPEEMAFCATSRGLTNEAYYAFQKLARVLGTNNVDLCARRCRAECVGGLKATLGYGAPTCSLSDLIGTDLLLLFGSDFTAAQPITAQYLHHAKKAGTRIVVVDAKPEDGGEPRPAAPDGGSAVFDARESTDFFHLQAGGEVAFINGVLKFLILAERIDRAFVERHTRGFAELAAAIAAQSWDMLEQRSGVVREKMQRFAEIYSQAQTTVLVYGGAGVKAIVNLALARGMMGREKCGIMPIHGLSGVQGGSDCGVRPDQFPGGFAVGSDSARRFSNLWHHPVPSKPGLDLTRMMAAASNGEIKFFYSMGADLLETMADADHLAGALARVPLRVHQGTVLNPSMLFDAAEAVVLLPGQTRYEQRGGGTSTSTERRIRFTPEIPGHRIGEALPEWEIPVMIGRKSMSNGDRLFPFEDTGAIRDEMSRVMPIYQGVDKLIKEGDQLQWGGSRLYRDGFTAMPDNRALFTVLDPQADAAI